MGHPGDTGRTWLLAHVGMQPAHGMLTRRAGNQVVRENLHQLRGAIARFHQDTGCYPARLSDLSACDARHLHTLVKHGSYQGPYLDRGLGIPGTGIPYNPFASAVAGNPSSETIIKHHWHYNAKTGQVCSAVVGITEGGKIYQSL